MRRFLSVLLSVFVIVTVCAAMCSADAASDFVRSLTPEQRELFLKALSEGSDEDTNHPVPSGVDPALKNGVKSGDIITGGNSDSPAPAPQLSNGQAWLEGAQRQIVNLKFSDKSASFQYLDRKTGATGAAISLTRLQDGGFQLRKKVPARTQMKVPEGCTVHCNPSTVDMGGKEKTDNYVEFSGGETIYFIKDVNPGFTIFRLW
ncbi:MAG: hypothetical protein IJT02_07920 [Synergistaceae bacterium]|nr:hypothetical protein [Synergistaceae bacterium]